MHPLVCDPEPEATHYKITLSTGNEVIVNPEPDHTMKYDISDWSGIITGEVRCGREWVLNGVPQGVVEWSDPAPFSLSGGSVTGGLSGLRIEK